jgi:glycosyltransferase involved in cell wall biosynthesis
MNKISAIILNSNNRNIDKTLKSVEWCDEVIEYKEPIKGDYAAARNNAMQLAKNEWVLFIDSDEIINKPIKINNNYDGFFIKRRDIFWNHKMRFGEAGTIKLLRLGKKSAGEWKRKVHEYWDIKNTGQLEEYLIHYPHPTIKSFIDQINFYTEIDAQELIKDGKKFSYFRLFVNPVGKFLQNYFLKLGFLDGIAGFAYAFMMSFHSLVVRVKMREIHGL